MTHENEPYLQREEVKLNEQQKAYSKEFLNDIYPDGLYPGDPIFDDRPTTFSVKFYSWKEQKRPATIKNSKDATKIQELETVSLFEVAHTTFETIEAMEFELNSPEFGEIGEDVLQEQIRVLNYWNWAYSEAYQASNLWKE